MLIAVEGNIGAGKTTLCQALVDSLGARLLPEPVDSGSFAILLERYYQDPKRWALTFQLDTIRARAVAQKGAVDGLYLQDRSTLGDQVFARVAHKLGFMDATEYQVYEDLRRALTDSLKAPVLVVYLRASPEKCMERVSKRARDCEHGLSLDYLEALHQAHDELAREKSGTLLEIPWDEFGCARKIAEQIRRRLSLPGSNKAPLKATQE